jgi:endonuclease YncB( thermonuclease family)
MATATEAAKAKAARLSAQRKERAKRLSDAKKKLDASAPKKGETADARAASLVRLGSALEASNPKAAADHYVRALKAAPEGPTAEDAKTRLKKLGINPEAAVLPVFALVRVVDGDTVIINEADGPETTVDLAGIKALDTGKPGTEALRTLLKGPKVAVRIESELTPEVPATAVLFRPADGLEINRELVRQGYARTNLDRPVEAVAEYQKLEQDARKAGRGLWKNAAKTSTPAAKSPSTSASKK